MPTKRVWSNQVFGPRRFVKKGHGRIEERYYCVASLPDPLEELAKAWPGIKSIGQAINSTVVGDKETSEVRYYISSRAAKVGEFADSVRKHWGIESMHWVLDVVFGEDACRIRTGHATENMSFHTKICYESSQAGQFKDKLEGQTQTSWMEHRLPRKAPVWTMI